MSGQNDLKALAKKIKEAIDIVDFVGERVTLKRSGKYWSGLSPFTKEKTPSFFVDPDHQSFRCFSTNTGGDLIDFVKITEGRSFVEALQLLAERAGVPFDVRTLSPDEARKEKEFKEKRRAFLKLNAFAARFFQDQLLGASGSMARDYCLGRGISKESLGYFGVGYAPDHWTALRDYLRGMGAPLDKAHELGLLRTKGGEAPAADGSNLFDTFRQRLIFPIKDGQGEVIGFGGRWLGPASAEAPKYINSPESLVYEKEKTLYHLDGARKSIREQGQVILVEGYMDCLTLVQSGFQAVVANCGTALTRQQATQLLKLAPRVICLYDSDEAGKKATERAMDLFLDVGGVPLLSAHLPNGKDPDEFLQKGGREAATKMGQILRDAPAAIDLWIEHELSDLPQSLQGKTEKLSKITKKIAKLKDLVAREARVGPLSLRLKLEESLIRSALDLEKERKAAPRSAAESAGGGTVGAPAKSLPVARQHGPPVSHPSGGKNKQIEISDGKKGFGAEWRFVTLLLQNLDWWPHLRIWQENAERFSSSWCGSHEVKRLLDFLLAPLDEGETDGDRLLDLQERVREKPEWRNFVAAALVTANGPAGAIPLEGAVEHLKDSWWKGKLQTLKAEIEKAEREGDAQRSEILLQELMELKRKPKASNSEAIKNG
jgi:DNA primase